MDITLANSQLGRTYIKTDDTQPADSYGNTGLAVELPGGYIVYKNTPVGFNHTALLNNTHSTPFNIRCIPSQSSSPHGVEINTKNMTELIEQINRSRQIDLLTELEFDWNGYGSEPPNSTAAENAKSVIEALVESLEYPDKIAPSAENGIAIYWYHLNKYALIECYNDGTILAGISDRDGYCDSWNVTINDSDLKEASDKMITFLYG